MKRLTRIAEIEIIQTNIERTERWLLAKPAPYYSTFGKMKEYAHDQEIKIKALAYWKRRFNRELELLKY